MRLAKSLRICTPTLVPKSRYTPVQLCRASRLVIGARQDLMAPPHLHHHQRALVTLANKRRSPGTAEAVHLSKLYTTVTRESLIKVCF